MIRTILLIVTILISYQPKTLSQKHCSVKEKKGKWALVKGKKKLTEFKFDEIQNNYNDYFISKHKNLWGVLNDKGETIIDFKYDEIKDLLQGNLIIRSNNKFGIIDTSANVLLKNRFDDIDHYSKDSTALVKVQSNWVYLKNNKTINKDTIIFKNPDQFAIYGNHDEDLSFDEKKEIGTKKLLQEVYQHLNYPIEARNNNISGMVVLGLWISNEGKIEQAKILRDIGYGCGEEGIKMIKKLGGWTPATKDGKKVWSEFILPIRFKIK